MFPLVNALYTVHCVAIFCLLSLAALAAAVNVEKLEIMAESKKHYHHHHPMGFDAVSNTRITLKDVVAAELGDVRVMGDEVVQEVGELVALP